MITFKSGDFGSGTLVDAINKATPVTIRLPGLHFLQIIEKYSRINIMVTFGKSF
ncbi:hypothetical protein BSCG_00421 [Bacteroides sp. 2_2_4]|nr:hypothetical protein BSCG_00421 [Bacteroides sp. 2_2_4]